MYIFFIALSIVECAPVENSPEPVETSSEIAYLPPIEAPPEIYAYEYNLTDTGYTYRWSILFFTFVQLFIRVDFIQYPYIYPIFVIQFRYK